MARAKTSTISARVGPGILLLIDQAAVTKGCARQQIVEAGAVQYANTIITEAAVLAAQGRKAMRRAKARLGGLAKAAKARQ